jgi:hypothetical protein
MHLFWRLVLHSAVSGDVTDCRYYRCIRILLFLTPVPVTTGITAKQCSFQLQTRITEDARNRTKSVHTSEFTGEIHIKETELKRNQTESKMRLNPKPHRAPKGIKQADFTQKGPDVMEVQ